MLLNSSCCSKAFCLANKLLLVLVHILLKFSFSFDTMPILFSSPYFNISLMEYALSPTMFCTYTPLFIVCSTMFLNSLLSAVLPVVTVIPVMIPSSVADICSLYPKKSLSMLLCPIFASFSCLLCKFKRSGISSVS